MLFELLRDEILFGNLILLLRCVRAHRDKLHTIAQRSRNLSYIIGRCNKNSLAQIEIKIEIIISKMGILLWI